MYINRIDTLDEYVDGDGELYFSRRRRFTPKSRRYHRTKSLRPGIRPTFTMLSSARFRAVVDTQSFLNSKFGMPLVHLEIEKYLI